MSDDYEFSLAQCDVTDKRVLESFRAKRRLWLQWIETDEHHAIWRVLHSMIWADTSFKLLTSLALEDEGSALNNTLVGETLLNGHVATQVLAIRRLVDRRKDVISLRRLVNDLRASFKLFTRENYVCFDGLPYDDHAVREATIAEHINKGAFWTPNLGPQAWSASSMAHEQFDRLAGIDPANRKRDDSLPLSLLSTIDGWINDSGADDLAEWSHAYLAHAGNPESRKAIDELQVTSTKISDATKALARVTEAISARLLSAGGRSGSLMPVAQFNQFEKLDRPIMIAGGQKKAYALWHQLSDERDHYLDDVEAELIGGHHG